jgi:hypothetical protein
MALAAAAQLLASALMLVQMVQANPDLPPSARDGAISVAESAITAATKAMGQAPGSACSVRSDKYTYRAGEVVVFYWEGAPGAKLEFDEHSSDVFPTPHGELLGSSGDYRKVVEESGYHFLALKATGANGESTACSAMVHVH